MIATSDREGPERAVPRRRSSSRRSSGPRSRGRASQAANRSRDPQPVQGLRAFLEADAVDFFGREAVTKRFIRSLAEDDPAARFLAVVGPSGFGEVLGRPRGPGPGAPARGDPGLGALVRHRLLPGSHPFRELETALLGVAVEPPPSLHGGCSSATSSVSCERSIACCPTPSRARDRRRPARRGLHAGRGRRRARARSSRACERRRSSRTSRVRVVATLRADFYDAPLSVPGFGDLLAARTEAITPMSPGGARAGDRGPGRPGGPRRRTAARSPR